MLSCVCANVLTQILVGSRDDAAQFECDQPYAVISFVGTSSKRTPPRLNKSPNFVGRIVIRADDCYDDSPYSTALTVEQARRIAKFARRMAPRIHTLFIHCAQGLGRSPGAAIAIARAFGLPWEPFLQVDDAAPNGHVTALVAQALETLGYDCGEDPAAYDYMYEAHLARGSP